MSNSETHLLECSPNPSHHLFIGGLFLDPIISPSFLPSFHGTATSLSLPNHFFHRKVKKLPRCKNSKALVFSSVSLRDFTPPISGKNVNANGADFDDKRINAKFVVNGRAALNPTKHLWAGAVAAMVARTVVAPLERLKLEYIVRGEQRHIVEVVRRIADTQGLKGFWKGNLVNILRTAPFKAINFCAYDTYRKQLRKMPLLEGTNIERFIAGAAAGITATVMCLPLDTIRTRIVAHGGEHLGGVVGVFQHMIKTEGFFSLYKGLLPSIISIAPSSAVFYGVYDILKSANLHSPEGRERIQNMKLHGEDLTALGQLELGPLRTLLYGAVSGACAEAATYPFEVIRRQLQMQSSSTKLSTFSTFVKIVEQGGVPGLYAGLFPSLLQVLPSAAISYFVYEFMKVVLKAE